MLLLDMGVTPESFKQQMGRDFYSTIGELGLYDGDRGLPDWSDYHRYLLERFPGYRHTPHAP